MKATASAMIAGGLALALWGGLVSRDVLAQAEASESHVVAKPAIAPAPVVRQSDQRAALNARLQAMLAEGKGSRLTDGEAATRPKQQRRSRSVQGLDRSDARNVDGRQSRSTVVRGARYVAPKLDLTSPPAIPRDPVTCLTQAVYYEARSESEQGQAAVAEVVMNRAASGRYPSDICEVVYQRNSRTCQFTFTCDGSIGRSAVNARLWAKAERIARGVYAGEHRAVLPRASVNYHANYVNPTWASRLERVRRIGAHIFYGTPLDGAPSPGAVSRPQESLLFVRNEEIERAYAALLGSSRSSQP
ncbi:hypothetical protein GVN18_32605 [Pseudomonas sp. ODNR1LW]|nr:hypothetical protein [Pseudomonas sp. ODNR1LW]